MSIIKKLLIPVAVVALISLGLAGCEKKEKKPAVEQSAEAKTSNEHPTKEKVSNEHPSEEHPSDNE